MTVMTQFPVDVGGFMLTATWREVRHLTYRELRDMTYEGPQGLSIGKARNERAELAAAAKSAASGANGPAALSVPMYMLDADALHRRVFGLNMKRARKLADNMSQEKLADMLKVDRREVVRWEGGREPRLATRMKIAKKLDQSLDFFYDEAVLDEEGLR